MPKSNIMNTYKRYDVIFEKGKGCRLYDINGKEYLDFVSGVAVNCLGHSNPAVVKAISEQSAKLMQVSNYYWNIKNIELAEMLVTYSDHDSVFFCNSGTEAVEGALKLARKYGRIRKGKDKNILIHMENSFHGRTMGALTVTGQEKYQTDFTPLIGGVKSAVFNDIESLKKVMDENTCGVILEPVQGEGGIINADVQYLKQVRDLCNRYDAVLIYDEVQCGIGRSGKLFAYQKFGVIPDVVCMAKGLGGGFPIGAFMANEKTSGILVPGDHGSTFGGNPLGSAAGVAVLKELIDGGIIDKVDRMGEYFINKLSELKGKYNVINEIKGLGLLLGISVKVKPKVILDKCFEKGLLLISAGSDVIRFLPPLNVEEKEIDEAIAILDEVFKEM